MKAAILFLACLALLPFTSPAQYTVGVTNSPYADLTGVSALPNASDSGAYFSTAFLFPTFDRHYANFNLQATNPVSAGGFMSKDGYLVAYDSIGKRDPVVFQCFHGNQWSAVAGVTTFSEKTEGTAGNRIFKFQWKDLVYAKVMSEKASFQVWLHEADGSVSYHYGPNTLPPATNVNDGGYTGIIVIDASQSNALFNEINLEGKPGAPAIYKNLPDLSLPTLDTIPPNGTVYTFQRSTATAIHGVNASGSFQLYPNPAGDLLHLQGNIPRNAKAAIYDGAGRLMKAFSVSPNNSIDIHDLPAGQYLFRLEWDSDFAAQPFIKK